VLHVRFGTRIASPAQSPGTQQRTSQPWSNQGGPEDPGRRFEPLIGGEVSL
jgi:hypothetical protein